MIEKFSFSVALERLKQGEKLQREGWNGKGQWIEIRDQSKNTSDSLRMTLPFIFIHTVQGDHVPWLASQTDMLAEDWMIFE